MINQSTRVYSTAVRVAQFIFDDLHDTRVLLIGSGEPLREAARHFREEHPLDISFATDLGAPFELQHFDIVLACAPAPRLGFGADAVARASRLRRRKPIFMVDFAVPRAIDPLIARLPDIFLYTAEELHSDREP